MAYGFNDDKSKKDLKAAILELAYPVGSIYQSTNNVSPQTFLGGTWKAITGRFLVAQGSNGQSGNAALNLSAGATGGETNHTLTINEMPAHSHPNNTSQPWDYVVNSASTPGGGSNQNMRSYQYTTNKVAEQGGGESHNNLPPYLAVYTWKRTA